ncbi:MAG TPA: GIY-YIG nuclease family protein [Candidatus Omnitrophota bacterium]|nr:GIY-YIG nuclease family protein [Candidatus Omnitrophota bacterium]
MSGPAKKRFKRSGRFYVYIVECSDGTYYTGYTPHVRKRVKLHNAGRGAKYTRDRRPVKLVWFKKYRYFKRAFKREMAIKKMSRSQKEKLII